jgi:hypothetical protein
LRHEDSFSNEEEGIVNRFEEVKKRLLPVITRMTENKTISFGEFRYI